MNNCCPNCGKENVGNASFCVGCGTPLAQNVNQPNMQQNVNQNYNQQNTQQNYNPNFNQQNTQQNYNPNFNQQGTQGAYSNYGAAPGVQNRNVGLAILLSLLTCGIYGIYWFVVLTDDINRAAGTPEDTSGIMAFLFTLLTCGIYGYYWYYKMAKKLYTAGQNYGKGISDNSVLYIVLGIFGLGIVNYCLLQSDLNKFSNQ